VAAAIVPGSDVMARGIMVNPLRTGLYEALEAMGARVELSNERIQSGEIVADIRVRHSNLRPCHVRPERVPAMIDEIPALAVACAFADGESVIEGLGELRVKESDRLGAIVAGLTACGVATVADGDALRIFGRSEVRGGGGVATRGDHRIAMAFLTLGLASQRPVEVDEAEMIATSFPGFVEAMQGIGADIQ
jgi:3-phosphoshikimate 1-carboxyvinyltransferase